MKTIYKFLFACVSGVINLVYHTHSARADNVTAGIDALGYEFYYVCTPCIGAYTNTGANCSMLFAATADGADIQGGGLSCNFYSKTGTCTGTAKKTICNPGSYWDPVAGTCVTGCPDGGYLPSDKSLGYWQEAATCESRHYYGGVACNRGPDGQAFDGWYDCKLMMYNYGGDTHVKTGYTDNVTVGGKYTGATITDCQKSQFTTPRGSGVYDPICNYTM